jgi:hypothetical protein
MGEVMAHVLEGMPEPTSVLRGFAHLIAKVLDILGRALENPPAIVTPIDLECDFDCALGHRRALLLTVAGLGLAPLPVHRQVIPQQKLPERPARYLIGIETPAEDQDLEQEV